MSAGGRIASTAATPGGVAGRRRDFDVILMRGSAGGYEFVFPATASDGSWPG
jgi:hypothetical protein